MSTHIHMYVLQILNLYTPSSVSLARQLPLQLYQDVLHYKCLWKCCYSTNLSFFLRNTPAYGCLSSTFFLSSRTNSLSVTCPHTHTHTHTSLPSWALLIHSLHLATRPISEATSIVVSCRKDYKTMKGKCQTRERNTDEHATIASDTLGKIKNMSFTSETCFNALLIYPSITLYIKSSHFLASIILAR